MKLIQRIKFSEILINDVRIHKYNNIYLKGEGLAIAKLIYEPLPSDILKRLCERFLLNKDDQDICS